MDTMERHRRLIKETSDVFHNFYGKNDVEAVIACFDHQFSWFGAGEQEYAVGKQKVTDIFRQFAGMVPRCMISQEEFDVIDITPEVSICSGRLWIQTDPSVNMYLRVHQRTTVVYRWEGDEPRCCHIHISNPYSEMMEGDVGFPTQMGNQSYEYPQECINKQKKQIEAYTALLERLSFKDLLTGVFNRNKFENLVESYDGNGKTSLGVANFDLNGLKETNDRFGHRSGDDVIRRAARHLAEVFGVQIFRIGGDEFVAVDEESDEAAFRGKAELVRQKMAEDEISCAMGFCWRNSGCSILEQYDEADQQMYQDKARFYSIQGNDRRRRP